MFSLIFFFLDVHKKPRHFNRLFRKEKNFVFFPKKLASHAGVFRGARFFLKTPAWEATKKWSWNIFGNLATLTAYSDKKKILFPLTGGPLDAPSL